MPPILIDRLDDPRLAPYRQLKATNATRGRSEFVVEGAKLVERLIASRFPVASVLATDRKLAAVAQLVPEAVPLYVIPHQLADVLVGFNFHQGVLGCGLRIEPPSLDAIVPGAGERFTLVVCPRLDNPENLGAILRLADVFGVAAVLAGPGCPDPLSRRVLRVSMGMALRVPVITTPRLPDDLRRLRDESGVELVAAVAHEQAMPFDSYRRPPRIALVLGRESSGLEGPWDELCRRRLVVPMRSGAESLNVAVAAGIMLYHLTRDEPRVIARDHDSASPG
jgi:tRNA G18 (ribose-2'-O)-methylase SpoU